MELLMLDRTEVLQIYERLVRDFDASDDPIHPAGIRDHHLLESAIGRQYVSISNILKYPDPPSSAATLGFGLCNTHPFYNGNKRTALVSILVHLDKNKLCLWGTNQDKLYEFILAVANHRVAEWVAEQLDLRLEFEPGEGNAEIDVRMMAAWLSHHAEPVRRGEGRIITYRELRRILRRFGYELENPADSYIHIVYYGPDGHAKNIDTISYRGVTRDVSIAAIKRVREKCGLTEENGIDSDVFYGKRAMPIDGFINRYRLVLRRLADA
jgi:prophage maintenance system killer protein